MHNHANAEPKQVSGYLSRSTSEDCPYNDGYCVHLDRETYRCTVHDKSPLPCRGFDCHDNEKWQVWLDYNKKIINPVLDEETNEKVGKLYKFPPDEIEK